MLIMWVMVILVEWNIGNCLRLVWDKKGVSVWVCEYFKGIVVFYSNCFVFFYE